MLDNDVFTSIKDLSALEKERKVKETMVRPTSIIQQELNQIHFLY
jgi:hypothetical protein